MLRQLIQYQAARVSPGSQLSATTLRERDSEPWPIEPSTSLQERAGSPQASGWPATAQDAGLYDTVFAVEHEPAAAATYKANFGIHVHDGDIEFVDPRVYPSADIIIGGPPCQGFSPLGRDRDPDSKAELNGLWEHFLAAVVQVRPRAFVIENVPQFQRSAQFNELLDRMAKHPFLSQFGCGYGVLNAADYGVPQTRRRGIFMAVYKQSVPWPPPPTHGDSPMFEQPYRTVRDAISDLPAEPTTDQPSTAEDGSQDLHIRRNPRESSLQRYRAIPREGTASICSAIGPTSRRPAGSTNPRALLT